MRQASLSFAAFVALAGCDPNREVDGSEPARPPLADSVAPEVRLEAWDHALLTRVLGVSGLGVGAPLYPLPVIAAGTGKRVVLADAATSEPTVLAIGSADDEAFGEDLRDLEAIAFKYDQRFTTVAVLAEFHEGRVHPMSASEGAAQREQASERAVRWRDGLGLTMPVYIPVPTDDPEARVLTTYYNLHASRTFMLADAERVVVYASLTPADFAAFDAALRRVLAPRAPASAEPP